VLLRVAGGRGEASQRAPTVAVPAASSSGNWLATMYIILVAARLFATRSTAVLSSLFSAAVQTSMIASKSILLPRLSVTKATAAGEPSGGTLQLPPSTRPPMASHTASCAARRMFTPLGPP
jgi:hypothetical protein